ncbi:MAG: SDR family NAD(P)-dependent oxidoreductase [Natronomonas sp.]|uniref:SDR family NAD(P)-dependent oxidoreductase n=1 Tax=Natronomonas sp. TaxID=2184060 RepID=UPI0028708554|nr:SDR family NAD(P)-dependent oxidoreductase [Natronomonas sp.]MDR9431963.1 SDR family NAD(P)-dependent oxidoreductase [Natronomonas sp.]
MAERTAALVTGAASGIGKCVVERFAADERHDVVACLDLDPAVDDLADSLGEGVRAYECDVANHDAVGEVVAAVEADADLLSVVNNAGVSRYFWIGDLEPDEWDRVVDVNLKGQYNVTRHATPPMFQREAGSVVNVSSGAGQRGSASGGVHYSAAKAGVLGLTKGLAKQLGPHVQVNCVVPGLIDTLMSESGLWTESEIEAFEAKLPLERVGDPDEVARVIEFCSGPGAAYMTGSIVNVDGGGSLS